MEIFRTPSDMPMRKATSNSALAEPHSQVRNTALYLFAEQGFQKVSLRKLASALSMQAGSLYNHISSKQDLLFELIDEHETDLLDAIETNQLSDTTPEEKLLAYIRTHVDFNVRHACRRSITQLEFRNLSPEQQQEILDSRNLQANTLSNIIQQGVQRQVFDQMQLKTTTALLLAMLNEAASMISTDCNTALDDTIESLQKIIVTILRAGSAET
ncbi:TetR/AcrR family transcriptional regulator [Pseudomonas sp. MBLB4136]|uniref:TetR/AcrR family transcriptional regulator n=1 Tax=Pseudomonas sp. MBLB4136 TaxID=3451558 RepID=UPI003F753805